MDTPFGTQQVVATPFFTDRDVEVKRVLHALRTRERLVVYGERRMGKTSLIARAADRLEGEGGVVVRADAWGARSLDDVNSRLLSSLPSTWLVGERLQGLLDTLRSAVVLGVDDQGHPTLRLSGGGVPSRDPADRFQRILEGIDRVAGDHGHPVAVWLDEFQRLETVREESVARLRSIVQRSEHLAWVFSGSIVGLVETLIGPDGPFHAIDRLMVRAIDREHMVSWIRHRMESHGVGISPAAVEHLHDRAGPVTEYVVKLAKDVFRLAAGAGRADEGTVDRAFDEVVADFTGSFELIWAELSQTKQQILRAVAAGEEQLTSGEVIGRYGLGSSGTATWAIKELQGDAHLAPDKPYRISNPFFRAWIRRRG